MLGALITIGAGAALSALGTTGWFARNDGARSSQLTRAIAIAIGIPLGACTLLWGAFESFSVLTSMALLSAAPSMWAFWALTAAADLFVGGLLVARAGRAIVAIGRPATTSPRWLASVEVITGTIAIGAGAAYIVWFMLY
jgi:hypothetical protein